MALKFNYNNYLFDLDGTITDPSHGIMACYAYALTKLGERVPPEEEIHKIIGPPLREGFAHFITNPTKERVEEAVRLYRERYTVTGIYEVELSPGAKEVLHGLKKAGKNIFVVTSKVQEYAVHTLEHLHVMQYVDAVYGSNFEGTLDNKADIVHLCVTKEKLDPNESIMIGDRLHDFHAAAEHGIRTIGVRCGFAEPGELEALDCVAIMNDLRELM